MLPGGLACIYEFVRHTYELVRDTYEFVRELHHPLAVVNCCQAALSVSLCECVGDIIYV